MKPGIRAFLYLTIGYWFFGFLVPFALAILPIAHSSAGFSMSSAQGVHELRFHGFPGDLILVLYVSDGGTKNLRYTTSSEAVRAISTSSHQTNAYASLISVALFAIISIPILRRIFANNA